MSVLNHRDTIALHILQGLLSQPNIPWEMLVGGSVGHSVGARGTWGGAVGGGAGDDIPTKEGVVLLQGSGGGGGGHPDDAKLALVRTSFRYADLFIAEAARGQ